MTADPRYLDALDPCEWTDCYLVGPHDTCQNTKGLVPRGSSTAGLAVPSWLVDGYDAYIRGAVPPRVSKREYGYSVYFPMKREGLKATADPAKASVLMVGGPIDGRILEVSRPIPQTINTPKPVPTPAVAVSSDPTAFVSYETLTYERIDVAVHARHETYAIYSCQPIPENRHGDVMYRVEQLVRDGALPVIKSFT